MPVGCVINDYIERQMAIKKQPVLIGMGNLLLSALPAQSASMVSGGNRSDRPFYSSWATILAGISRELMAVLSMRLGRSAGWLRKGCDLAMPARSVRRRRQAS